MIVDERFSCYMNSLDPGHSPFLENLEQAAKDFGMKSAYPLTKSRRDAEKLGEEKIRKSLELLDGCDKRLKSTSADGRLVLEQAIVKLFEISRGKTV